MGEHSACEYLGDSHILLRAIEVSLLQASDDKTKEAVLRAWTFYLAGIRSLGIKDIIYTRVPSLQSPKDGYCSLRWESTKASMFMSFAADREEPIRYNGKVKRQQKDLFIYGDLREELDDATYLFEWIERYVGCERPD